MGTAQMRGKCGYRLVWALVTVSLGTVAVVTGDVVAIVPLALASVLLATAWQFGEPDWPSGSPPDVEQDIHYPFGPPKNRP